jgi:hypothetical protein
MKKTIMSCLIVSCICIPTAEAHGYYGYRGGWVAPAIIGGVIGYGLARPYYSTPIYAPPPPVYVTPPPVYYQQYTPYEMPVPSCTAWTETQNPDGTVTKTRNCN